MVNTYSIGEVFKSKNQNEKKDKIEILEGKKFFLYFLFDGPENKPNSSRAISACMKFIKNNYNYYLNQDTYNIKKLLIDANKKILELKLPGATTSVIAVYESKDKKKSLEFVSLGRGALYSVLKNEIVRIGSKNENIFLGENELFNDDIHQIKIKKSDNTVFLCCGEFLGILAHRRKDFVKILNYKSLLSMKDSFLRMVKNKSFNNLSYLVIKR